MIPKVMQMMFGIIISYDDKLMIFSKIWAHFLSEIRILMRIYFLLAQEYWNLNNVYGKKNRENPKKMNKK